MRRVLIAGIIALLAVGAIASQLALPPLAEDRAADGLTARGGTAHVSISAFPAIRLLVGDGDRLDVSGSGLVLPVSDVSTDDLGRLDGFDSVSVRLSDVRAGPVTLRQFDLRRDGSNPYRLRSTGVTSLSALARFGGRSLGGFLGALALRLGARATLGAAAHRPIPIHLDMDLTDEGGRVIVVGGSGSVAGIPTGPLAELITAAVAVRI
jgi:hypothetical protein